MNSLDLGRIGLPLILGALVAAGCNGGDKDDDGTETDDSGSTIDTMDTAPTDTGPSGPNAFTIGLESPIADGKAGTTVIQGQALPGIFYFSIEDVTVDGNSITDSELVCLALIDIPEGSGTYAAATTPDTDADTDTDAGGSTGDDLASWLAANDAVYGYEIAKPATIDIINVDDGSPCDLDEELWGADPIETLWPGSAPIRIGFPAELNSDLESQITMQDAALLDSITGARILDPSGEVNDFAITQAVTNDDAQNPIEVDNMLSGDELVDGYFVVSSLLFQVLDAN